MEDASMNNEEKTHANAETAENLAAEAESAAVDPEPSPDGSNSDGNSGADSENSSAKSDRQDEIPRPRQPTYVETLEQKLHEARTQLHEYIGAYKQVKQEMEEFKKRLEREAQRDITMLRGKVVTDLVEVFDNLDRSIKGGESGGNSTALLTGLKMVQGQFMDKLQGLGLSLIEPLGQRFNPKEAEAVDLQPTSEQAEDDTIVAVFARGYKLNERVIKPAIVRVARYGEAS